MKLQLPSFITSGSPHKSQQVVDPCFETRTERRRQLTIRGMSSVIKIAITVASAAAGTGGDKTMITLAIIDEHLHFGRRRRQRIVLFCC